jgi:hypothetical protein
MSRHCNPRAPCAACSAPCPSCCPPCGTGGHCSHDRHYPGMSNPTERRLERCPFRMEEVMRYLNGFLCVILALFDRSVQRSGRHPVDRYLRPSYHLGRVCRVPSERVRARSAVPGRVRAEHPGGRSVAGSATPASSAGHAPTGPTIDAELTFRPNHSMGAGHLKVKAGWL